MSLLSIAVLGAGNWGTTLAQLAASNGHDVALWTRDHAQALEMAKTRRSTRAHVDLAFAPSLTPTSDLHAALAGAELVLVAIPSQAFRSVMRTAREWLRPDHLLVHGTKGLEAETHVRMSQIVLAETAVRQVGVVAGPNIAVEVAAGMPAATVAASPFPGVARAVKCALSSPQMMVFASKDVLGVEICGALKNVVAIAAGMADEMKVGDNAKAFLVTRGMVELTRLAFVLGAEATTTSGLAGIGDLMVTCASVHSRNHRVGVELARGRRLDEVLRELGMVAEGVYASVAARALAHAHDLDMPLFDRIDRVLHAGLAPQRALEELMRLPAGHDVPRLPSRAVADHTLGAGLS